MSQVTKELVSCTNQVRNSAELLYRNSESGMTFMANAFLEHIRNISKNPLFLISRTYNTNSGAGQFDGNQITTGTHALLAEQETIFKKLGYDVFFLFGTSNVQSKNTFILPIINSHTSPPLEKGRNAVEYFTNYKTQLQDMLVALSPFTNLRFLVHNTSNSASHNPIFGNAIARIGETSNFPAVFHNYDFRGAAIDALKIFTPANVNNMVRLLIGSAIKKKELLTLLEGDTRINHDEVVTFASPFDIEKFLDFHRLPESLADLAPNFVNWIHEVGLDPELLDLDPYTALGLNIRGSQLITAEVVNEYSFLIPARIVTQKEIPFTVTLLVELQKKLGRPIKVIISGPTDLQKPSNIEHFDLVKTLVSKVNTETNGLVQVFLLGGVPEKYFSELMRCCSAVLGIFRNEGYGLFIPQSAITNVPLIISADDSLVETGHGNCLSLPLRNNDVWTVSESLVDTMVEYLQNKQKMIENIKKLTIVAHLKCSLQALLASYKKIMS